MAADYSGVRRVHGSLAPGVAKKVTLTAQGGEYEIVHVAGVSPIYVNTAPDEAHLAAATVAGPETDIVLSGERLTLGVIRANGMWFSVVSAANADFAIIRTT